LEQQASGAIILTQSGDIVLSISPWPRSAIQNFNGAKQKEDNMRAVKKKSETCEEQLRRMCRNIADSISRPDLITDEETGEKREQSASDWMEGTYDIRYYINGDKSYLGAEILCAGGGPTIWVNTYTKYVEGYWGGDKVEHPFTDRLGLDNYCEELYGC